jgi:TonB family protein
VRAFQPRPSRNPSAGIVASVFAVSVVAHAALVLLVRLDDPTAGKSSRALSATAAPGEGGAAERVPGWQWTCATDVSLGYAAQLLYCATPLAEGLEPCTRRAARELSDALSACERADEPVAVAFLTQEQLDEIQPEPLLALLDPAQQQAFEQEQAEAVEELHEEARRAQERPPQKAQVVEITRPDVEQAPDDARFVSEYDSKVERETVARGSTEEMVRRPQPRELPPQPKVDAPSAPESPEHPSEAAARDRDAPPSQGELAMRRPGPREAPQEEIRAGTTDGSEAPPGEGLAPRRGDGAFRSQPAREGTPGEDGVGREGGAAPVPDLRPSEDLLARAVGGGSVDKLDGVESGEETALSSRRWMYATFFNRMKRQVAQNWHPAEVYLRRDPTGKVYGTKDRVTILQVTLEPDGALRQIYIQRRSGVDFLDEEAIRAFRAAQPFPNPPAGLVDPQSRLITFTFGFHFAVGGDPGRWRIFRHR